MSSVFVCFKHLKLPICIKIPVTIPQIVLDIGMAINPTPPGGILATMSSLYYKLYATDWDM